MKQAIKNIVRSAEIAIYVAIEFALYFLDPDNNDCPFE